jgi:hypothetical protein
MLERVSKGLYGQDVLQRDSKGCNGQDVLNFPFIIVAVFDRLTVLRY